MLLLLVSTLGAQYYTVYQSLGEPREKIIYLDIKQGTLIVREKSDNDMEKPLLSVPIDAIDSIAFYPPPIGYSQPIASTLVCGFALVSAVYIYSEFERFSDIIFNLDKLLKASLTGAAVGGIAWLSWEIMSNTLFRKNKIMYDLHDKSTMEKTRVINQIVAAYKKRAKQEKDVIRKSMLY